MLIPNRFTSTEKPTNHPHLEVEPLDVRSVPALLNGADALVDATLAVDAVAAGGGDNAAVPPPQAPQEASAPHAASASLTAPIDAVAVTFPAADAALAAARMAAPDAVRGIVPPAIASALQPGRLELSSEMTIPGTAALDNAAAAIQALFPPPVPQPALPDTTSTIPTMVESSSPPTAAVPPTLVLPETRSPIPSDPFRALGATPAPLATSLPEMEGGLAIGAVPAREAVAEARPANVIVTWQPPTVTADTVPITETAMASPAASNRPLLDEESTAKSAWPLAPAIAALYEILYRGNRS